MLDGELAPCLRQLGDCPFVVKGRDVEFVGFDVGVLILLTHHLDIQVVSRHQAVFDRMVAPQATAAVRARRVARPVSLRGQRTGRSR